VTVEEAPERADPEARTSPGKTFLQFDERDVFAIRDRLHDEGAVRLDPLRTAISPLALGLGRTGLTKGLNPTDRAGRAHPKPHRRRPARTALLNLAHDPLTQVVR
jgi:hypothetical protein